jgi:uncharacterized protein
MSNLALMEHAILRGSPDAEKFYQLGVMYSTGRSVPADMVSAHKWFNIAAMRGYTKALGRRSEIAGEMSKAEIAIAQRAARDWVTHH